MSFDKMSTDENVKKTFIKFEATPQPHFIPGYTGFCPDLSGVVGASYGRATNEILQKRPEIAGRLSSLEPSTAHPEKAHEKRLAEIEKDKNLINSRFPDEGRKIWNDYIIPGYSGHVPNMSDLVGVNYSTSYIKSVAKFIRQKDEDAEESISLM